MTETNFQTANRSYRRAFWPIIFVYVVICFAGPFLLKLYDPASVWLRTMIAMASALPIALIFVILGRYLLKTDEYTRLKHAEAMMLSAGTVFTLTTLYGFLQVYQLVPSIWIFIVAPVFFALYGLIYFARGGQAS